MFVNKTDHPEYLKEVFSADPRYNTNLIPATKTDAIKTELRKYMSENALESLDEFMGKSVSIRLRPNQALYLTKLAAEIEAESVQATLGYIIDQFIERDEMKLEHKEVINTKLRVLDKINQNRVQVIN